MRQDADCQLTTLDMHASPTATAPATATAEAHALPCVLDIEASSFGRASNPIEVGDVLPNSRAACLLVRLHAGATAASVDAP